MLEQVPQRLVVDLVVILHLGAFDEGSQCARAAVSGGLFQFGIAALHVSAENLRDPGRVLEILNGRLNVVRQVASASAQIFGTGDFAVEAGFEDAVEREVRVGVRGHGANFSAHGAVVADGNTHHGAAINGGGANLIGRFEMRVKTAIGVHAGVEDQA